MSKLKDIISDYDETSTASIIAYARDYHKDTFGFRPEGIDSDSDWDIRAYYITMIMYCDEYLIKTRGSRDTDGWDE